MPPTTFREERLGLIIQRVMADGKVSVNDLADAFEVSASSIRLDLNELEARGIVTRVHGGAIASETLHDGLITQKSSFQARMAALQPEKDAIGRAAAALVPAGSALMIDGGSTTVYVARHLGTTRDLVIVTNAVTLLSDLLAIPDAQIHVTGGALDRRYGHLLGEVALDTIARFRTELAILGMDGVSVEGGLSVTDPAVAATKRRMMAAGTRLIVVADHTKLGRRSLYSLSPVNRMDTLVTDSGADPDLVEAIRACGPEVIVAS